MANRYKFTDEGSMKEKLVHLEGFVSIGTGGLLNAPPAYPIFPAATGATGVAGQTGPPLGVLPGQATAAVPTGWVGGFSGCIGLLRQGVAGIQRVATGMYAIQLEDDWVSLHNMQIQPLLNATGCTSIAEVLLNHTVGLGNSITTGGLTYPVYPGPNPKNVIWVQFHASGLGVDIPNGGGFYLDITLKDSLSGGQ